jgi:hypothetical protein
LVLFDEACEGLSDGIAELVRLQWHRPAVLPQHPAREQVDLRELRLEDAAVDRPGVVQRPLHPPRRVVGDADPCGADRLPDLPRTRNAVRLDVEVRWYTEVSLPPRREADVSPNP